MVSINVPPPQLWGGQHTKMFVDHVTVFSQSVSHIRLSHTIYMFEAIFSACVDTRKKIVAIQIAFFFSACVDTRKNSRDLNRDSNRAFLVCGMHLVSQAHFAICLREKFSRSENILWYRSMFLLRSSGGGQHTEMFVNHVTVFSQSVSHIRLSHTI